MGDVAYTPNWLALCKIVGLDHLYQWWCWQKLFCLRRPNHPAAKCNMIYAIIEELEDILCNPQWSNASMTSTKWAATMCGDHYYHCWLDEPSDMTMCVWKSLPRVPGIWDQRDTQAPAQQFIGCKIWDHKHKLKYSGVDEAVRKKHIQSQSRG